MHYYELLVAGPLPQAFTYKSPQILSLGTIAHINFHGRNTIGLVKQQIEEHQIDPILLPKIKLIGPISEFMLPQSEQKLLEKISCYYLTPPGLILKQMLPLDGITPLLPKDELKSPECNFNLHTLDQNQEKIYQAIKLYLNHFNAHLIDGETGSGKTEIYLHLAKDIIESGGQVLILLPEIVLTKQLMNRFRERLGFEPTEWHSRLTKSKRRLNFHHIFKGQARFIIGARSALLLPYHNLKMIIVDEEHDRSYKQEEGAAYHARDMAIWKANILDINVLLTSATPSLETMYNAKEGKFHYHALKTRFGNSSLPKVEIIDLNVYKLPKNSLLSAPLLQEITKVVQSGKQALLFLNRRGFAPIIKCIDCGAQAQCSRCNTHLVYHKAKNLELCHYCGYRKKYRTVCADCASENLTLCGHGIEKLEEEVRHKFPTARVLTLTSDTTARVNAIEEALNQITNHEVDIILGTQIIAKGLHFPKIQLVAIVDAEANIIGYDPRAFEHTYQILHQVAGRAGRADHSGVVMLQTHEPDNPVFQCLQSFDKPSFYEFETDARKLSNSPPFTRLIAINAIGGEEITVIRILEEIKALIPKSERIELLGPAPTPIYYMDKKYRYRLIIRADKQVNIQKIIDYAFSHATYLSRAKNKVSVSVDIDAYNFI